MLGRTIPLLGAVLLLPSLLSAQAQTDSIAVTPPAVGAPSAIQADTFSLDQILVTANRLPTPRALLPQSVTLLEGADLAARGIYFLQDALREVPGLHVVRTGSIGGTTSVFLRGGNSNFVKVLVDGIPVNEPGGRFDFGSFSLENVERIEVVRGPSSVLYGSDAVSGVIQIFTRKGRGEPSLSASMRGGSLGSFFGEVGARGAAERMNYALSVGRSETAGIYDANNRFASWVGSGRVAFFPDAQSQVAVILRVQEARYGFPTNSSGEVVDRNQFTFDEGVHLAVEGARSFTPGLEGRLLLRASRGERGLDNKPDSPADTIGFAFQDERLGTTLRRGADARLTGRQGRLSWTGGLDWEIERERLLQRTTSNFGGGPSVSSSAFEGDRWNLAGYLHAAVEGPAGSIWNVGGRIDENEVFGSFQTGQVGVVIPVGALGRVRGSAGTAYKAPTFAQQFAVTPFEVGDPDLVPETSSSWEVGWDVSVLERRLTLGASWFDQRFRDLIQYGYQGPGLPTYANEARARAQGMEVALDWRILSGVRAGVEYTWTDATTRNVEGDRVGEGIEARLLRRPEHQWSAHLRGQRASGHTAGLTLVRVGDRIDNDFRSWPAQRVVLDAYTTVDLDAQIPLGGRGASTGWFATLRVENLLDEAFETIVGFPGMGRVVLIGVRWNP